MDSAAGQLSALYSPDLRARAKAAAEFTVFADGGTVPRRWRSDWEACDGWRDPTQGLPWPESMRVAAAARRWPRHAFGTANAAVLVLLHRPGGQEDEAGGVPWIEPRTPTLGGISHAHVEQYAPRYLPISRTWTALLRHLRAGLSVFRLEHPLAAVMVACLIDSSSRDRVKGAPHEYRAALATDGRLARICGLIEPLAVIACGGHVHTELDNAGWSPPNGAPVFRVEHPSYQGWGSGGPAVQAMFRQWARRGQPPSATVFNAANAARVAGRSARRN